MGGYERGTMLCNRHILAQDQVTTRRFRSGRYTDGATLTKPFVVLSSCISIANAASLLGEDGDFRKCVRKFAHTEVNPLEAFQTCV